MIDPMWLLPVGFHMFVAGATMGAAVSYDNYHDHKLTGVMEWISLFLMCMAWPISFGMAYLSVWIEDRAALKKIKADTEKVRAACNGKMDMEA